MMTMMMAVVSMIAVMMVMMVMTLIDRGVLPTPALEMTGWRFFPQRSAVDLCN